MARPRRRPGWVASRRATLAFACLLGASACTDSVHARAGWDAAVTARFDDGAIMTPDQARCVGVEVRTSVDWAAIAADGIMPDELFDADPADRPFTTADQTALLDAIETCRGTVLVVLDLFRIQLDLDATQSSCFADLITEESARDLLGLVLFGDRGSFADSEGQVLLGLCSR